MVIGATVQVVANRFQEALLAVRFSGVTYGLVNVTGQNISTYCLLAFGGKLSNNNNLVLQSSTCDELEKALGDALGF
jgi:hypothetical protein